MSCARGISDTDFVTAREKRKDSFGRHTAAITDWGVFSPHLSDFIFPCNYFQSFKHLKHYFPSYNFFFLLFLPHGLEIKQPEKDIHLSQENVYFKFPKSLWRDLKIPNTSMSFFPPLLALHTYTYKYTNTSVQKLCCDIGFPSLPLHRLPEMILNFGISEGWKYFFKITMVLEITQGDPYFFCISLLLKFYFFPRTASNIWTMLLLYLKQNSVINQYLVY